jgi:general secretion pathway protein A
MNPQRLALYGLKWNPFTPAVPVEGLYQSPQLEHFCRRIEAGLVRDGGFALISGEPGAGKSVALRLLAERLRRLPELSVGALTHPSSNLADFYREMGDLFGLELRPHNRWGGFKALRARWLAHLDGSLLRPVLLIDEAQEMHPAVLNELRLLTSTDFDSRSLLSVVLAGDGRLLDKLRRDDLLPLGSRIRTRLAFTHAERDELMACLKHLLEQAGNARLMSAGLMQTLCDHAAGNLRILTSMAAELLTIAADQERTQLDEQLYFEVFSPIPTKERKPR